MTYVVKFDEGARQMILAGLDMLVRDVGNQLKERGGPVAQDAAQKIINIANVAVGIERAAKFEEPADEAEESQVNKDAAEGGKELPGQEPFL